jgi:8-oxo-dGTP pyrophosphatase MutT (NUDIX family)
MQIEQLGPPNADHSTGLILRWRDRLLFAVEPIHQWQKSDEGLLARFVGIGGHLELGETWGEAVRREALEEARLRVSLQQPERTYLLREDTAAQDITSTLDWPDPPRPLFIWSAQFRFDSPPNEWVRHFVNAVFLASVPDEACPCPAAEMPAVLALSEAQLLQTAVYPTLLRDLLVSGATIWESEALPRLVRIAPGGSAQWYTVLLDHLSDRQRG